MLITCKLPRNWFYRRLFHFPSQWCWPRLKSSSFSWPPTRFDSENDDAEDLPEELFFWLGICFKCCLIYESEWVNIFCSNSIILPEQQMTYPALQIPLPRRFLLVTEDLWTNGRRSTFLFSEPKISKSEIHSDVFLSSFELRKLSSTDLLKY